MTSLNLQGVLLDIDQGALTVARGTVSESVIRISVRFRFSSARVTAFFRSPMRTSR